MARVLSVIVAASLATGMPLTGAAALDAKDIAGLYQFPDRLVWIRINPDGTAYQCRIATRSPLVRFVSKGSFKAPDQLVWEEHWGTERIEHAPGVLTVHSKGGTFTYLVSNGAMVPECN